MIHAPNMEILLGRELHEEVIEKAVMKAQRRVWIATADLKDMHVKMARGYSPILDVFNRLAKTGVHFRIIHASTPSGPFRDTFEKYKTLVRGAMELQICPRSHWKMVLVDGDYAYLGSANFTGAGLGVKKAQKRNLEIGAVTREKDTIRALENEFDKFWMGEHCDICTYRKRCPDPIG